MKGYSLLFNLELAVLAFGFAILHCKYIALDKYVRTNDN